MNRKFHEIESVGFEGDELLLRADGEGYRIPLAAASPLLARATDAQRRLFRISPSGYGIHWPALDEDLSVDGLIRVASADKSELAAASA